ncbi:MAG: hypothetical protein ABII82_07160 [Verrucomicrobiota bacterium]
MLRRLFNFIRCLLFGHRPFIPPECIGEYHLMLFRTVWQEKGLSSSMSIQACRRCGTVYVADYGQVVQMPVEANVTHLENVHNVDETSATTG